MVVAKEADTSPALLSPLVDLHRSETDSCQFRLDRHYSEEAEVDPDATCSISRSLLIRALAGRVEDRRETGTFPRALATSEPTSETTGDARIFEEGRMTLAEIGGTRVSEGFKGLSSQARLKMWDLEMRLRQEDSAAERVKAGCNREVDFKDGSEEARVGSPTALVRRKDSVREKTTSGGTTVPLKVFIVRGKNLDGESTSRERGWPAPLERETGGGP